MFYGAIFLFLEVFSSKVGASQESTRLYEEMMSNYNKLVRPAKIPSEAIEIQFKFKLLQILDVHEKDQVLTTSGILIHKWADHRLSWVPSLYGNVTMLHVPGELIWLPDIILYNNAHGTPAIASITKADVYANGSILWEPPVIYNSMCRIDTKWFPYDEQFCDMKFGSWTYGGFELDMVHLDSDVVEHISYDNGTEWRVELGVDISEYVPSVEFDLLSVVGTRHEKRYPCCDYPVIDITYYLNIRRKKLFYTINLMFPCIGIATLTSFVFYLPSESHNKINLCISVLVSLTVFFLLLIEIVPPTSLVTPLIGKYLVFTMIMVTLSVSAYQMPKLIRRIFIHFLGNYILVYRMPGGSPFKSRKARYKKLPTLNALRALDNHFKECITMDDDVLEKEAVSPSSAEEVETRNRERNLIISPEMRNRVSQVGYNIRYIERILKKGRRDEDLRADWKFVAMVIDRLMLILFSITIFIGTLYATLSAPSVTDDRVPVTEKYPPKNIYQN
ncbi:neurotransmitter-gated ion-channel ligand binding domain-containing protein [Ditylenchus destructor]|uniref:Neurotransmitter-gated ion-channel ligand binding domain-containing protein n=1 Tax=Ditylenchus destructor TaxID=166010 RepID=A0AAD4N3W5_9BILA|nr:neurotransmitter-gated ion-channel ligand binding domain-containing protein [Ditylenchus destructor]